MMQLLKKGILVKKIYYAITIIILLHATMSHSTNPIEHYSFSTKIMVPHDKKIVLVGGCFDILHFGHIQFLQKAKELGDYLVVALEPDERIRLYKQREPLHNQQERAYNLLALRYVDKIITLPELHGFNDYYQLVQSIKPHVIAITDNDSQYDNKKKQAESVNALCVVVNERISHLSSSAIYEKLKNC